MTDVETMAADMNKKIIDAANKLMQIKGIQFNHIFSESLLCSAISVEALNVGISFKYNEKLYQLMYQNYRWEISEMAALGKTTWMIAHADTFSEIYYWIIYLIDREK